MMAGSAEKVFRERLWPQAGWSTRREEAAKLAGSSVDNNSLRMYFHCINSREDGQTG